MIKLTSLIENRVLTPKFSIGDRIIVTYPQHNNVERVYRIVEIRKYPQSGNILYIYETAPGHHRCVLEKNLDVDGKTTHDKTGWTNA